MLALSFIIPVHLVSLQDFKIILPVLLWTDRSQDEHSEGPKKDREREIFTNLGEKRRQKKFWRQNKNLPFRAVAASGLKYFKYENKQLRRTVKI